MFRQYFYNDEVKYKDSEIEATQADNPLVIPKRYDLGVEDLADYDFQITYKFSSIIRKNIFNGVKYGASNMTIRRLYEILVHRFNNGHYFIDEYFEYDYPNRMKPTVDKFLQSLKETILKEYESLLVNARITKKGELDKRQRKLLAQMAILKVKESNMIKKNMQFIADIVKDDIINAMATGVLHLNRDAFSLAESTQTQRKRAGFSTVPLFYASAQLIEGLKLYFRLERKRWQTSQSIWV